MITSLCDQHLIDESAANIAFDVLRIYGGGLPVQDREKVLNGLVEIARTELMAFLALRRVMLKKLLRAAWADGEN